MDQWLWHDLSVLRCLRVACAGMPVTSVRELRVLQQCKHPNLVELKKVVTGSKLDRCVAAVYNCPAPTYAALASLLRTYFQHACTDHVML